MTDTQTLPEGWRETTLGEICDRIFSGGTPNTQMSEYWNGNLNWLSSGETGEMFIYGTTKKITEEGAKNSSTRIAFKGMPVIATAGQGHTRGQISLLKTDTYINQSIIAFDVCKELADNNWLFYNLYSRYNELRQISEGNSVRGSLTTNILKNLEVTLPSLAEQKSIASILSSFDDKIELLREQNKTLEQTAQTIFYEWFGKYSVDDELPEGWRVGKLGEIVTHIKNNIVPSKKPNKIFVHYSMPSFDNHKKPIYEKGETILSNKYQVIPHSFLISKLNPSTPRIWTIFAVEENAICSTEFQVFKPTSEHYFSLCHCFLNSQLFTDELSQKAHGTSSSHQRVKPQDILELAVIIPDVKVIYGFNESIISMLQKISNNDLHIESLSKIRDELLSKLVSGEVLVGAIS